MKQKNYILGLFTLFASGLFAQIPTNEWAKSFGSGTGSEVGKDIVTDATGNVYTVGHFDDAFDADPGAGTVALIPNGGADIFITKFDSNGNFVWAKQIGGMTNDAAYGIALNQFNHLYVTGYFSGSVDFDPSPSATNTMSSYGGTDIFMLKLDLDGNYLWSKRVGSVLDDVANTIDIDESENVYIAGSFKTVGYFNPDNTSTFVLSSAGTTDAFVAAYTSAGLPIFANRIGGTGATEAIATAIDISYSGYPVVTGYFSGAIDIDPSPGTTDNRSSNGAKDIFLVRFTGNGLLTLAKTFGGLGDDQGNGVTGGSNDEITFTGFYNATVDFNSDPIVDNSFTTNGLADVFISQVDINGDHVWTKSIGSSNIDKAFAITTDELNEVYLTGNFKGSMDANPGSGSYQLFSTSGGYDIFLLKLTSIGDFGWARFFNQTSGVLNTNQSTAIHVDANETVYTTGYIQGAVVDFSLNMTNYNLGSMGQGDVFISKISTGLVLQLTCPADQNLYTSTTPPVMPDLVSQAAATTNCVFNSAVMITQSPAAGSTLNFGPNIVTLTAADDCFGSQTCQVTVNYINDLTLTVQCPGNQTTTNTVCADYTSLATVTSVCPSGGVVTTQTPAAGSPLSFGANTITLESSNSCGLTSSCTFVVDRTLGLNETSLSILTIYPNPTKNKLTIESSQPTTLRLINVQGQQLQTIEVNEKTIIDVSSLQSGVYMLIGEGSNPIRFIKE